MTWYRDLYIGPLMERRCEETIKAVDEGRYPPLVYLLTVSQNSRCQLDIIEASQLKHDYIRENCVLIVGIALGRSEAFRVLRDLVDDVYRGSGDADIRAWLSEEH